MSGLLALGLMATTLAACGSTPMPTGTYTTNIPDLGKKGEAFFTGTWTVTFGKHGSYTITSGSEVGLGIGQGSFVRGTTLVINPLYAGSCGPGRGTGTYKLKLAGRTLRFIRITDPCKVRAGILAHTFTKAH